MGDYSIRARFQAACPPRDLRRWLITAEGIAGWWSDSVSGSAGAVGDVFGVTFPTTEVPFVLKVSELNESRVAWHVPDTPPWWKGTSISFQLDGDDEGGTSLLFTHGGFEPDDPIIEVITPAWMGFLNNLIDVAGTGEPNPAVVS